MKKDTQLTREEFEKTITTKLHQAITKAKKIRGQLRQLEKDIANRQSKIDNYQMRLTDIHQQLVKIQAIIFSKGTS